MLTLTLFDLSCSHSSPTNLPASPPLPSTASAPPRHRAQRPAEDVFRARLKTVGVCEYTFAMEAGYESGAEWRIADVGGSRSQTATTTLRADWVLSRAFADDVWRSPPTSNTTVDAIIFLAPISAFDQTLVEDKSVNRLEDSVYLWKAVCANALLAKVELILFLNKCDILDAKLRAGIRLAKYLRSFGDRPNDLEHAQKCESLLSDFPVRRLGCSAPKCWQAEELSLLLFSAASLGAGCGTWTCG
ncbi:hypothetical protein EIP86_007343 [Pleurotus ostreatoroseus]|nr:hypothetical protein EIP86_007343 [Pleurotus ostreatoroseus]